MDKARHYYLLALSLAKQRDLSGAVTNAQTALTLDPQNEQARKLLVICLCELGMLTAALDLGAGEYTDAIENERADVRAAFERIRVFIGKKKWRKAAKEARAISHQSVCVLNLRGCLLAARRRRGTAFFIDALRKDSTNRLAIKYLCESKNRPRSDISEKLLRYTGR